MTASAPAVVAQTSAPAIPFKRDTSSTGSVLADGAVGVLLISLIAIAAVLVIRKKLGLKLGLAPAANPGLLKVLETQRLGPRALLSVVEFSGSHYLIAQGEHGISCVASKPVQEQS